MTINPLFNDPPEDKQPHKDAGYVLKRQQGASLTPVHRSDGEVEHDRKEEAKDTAAAAHMIRQKLEAIYAEEPDAKQEAGEVEEIAASQRSKHQTFMHRLTTSGKSLAQIQTEWHVYYNNLPDDEKHEVWHEFYEANTRRPSTYTQYVQKHVAEPTPLEQPQQQPQPQIQHHNKPAFPKPAMPLFAEEPAEPVQSKAVVAEHSVPLPEKLPQGDRRKRAEIKKQILKKVRMSEQKQVKAKHHIQSLIFGLSTGALVLFVFLFSFFNEMIIAPFIQPSRHVSATPIILNADSVAPSADPEVIIPKINVQIPVIYDNKDISEAAVQSALERGVIHYPTTVHPGEKGNAAFFGHSSNNIFNKGKYKFAFVKLHELVPGDTFYLTYDKKVYAYKVFKKQVVTPDQVSVLNPVEGYAATAALITCDPPGTSTNRLVVWGEQVSPDPTGAAEGTAAPVVDSDPQALPSNGPSLWKRLTGGLFD